MQVPFIDLRKQYQTIKDELNPKIKGIFETGSYVLGAPVAEFEGQFAQYCQTNFGVGVNSGTDALILALKALGLGQGDEVITVSNTFIATVEAIVHAGGKPVFVDILADTYNIDLKKLRDKITPKTRAIIAVHLYGQMVQMDEIMKIAKENNLYLIEDAAEAHGGSYKGRRAGSFGDIGCFSFYPTKNLGGCGDGGMALCNDEKIAGNLRKLRDHGSAKKYYHDLVGYNSRLDALQAVVLGVKLKYLDQWNRQRKQKAKLYEKLLSGVPGVVIPKTAAGVDHVYYVYVIRVLAALREKLQSYLSSKGIGTMVHFPIPAHLSEAFKYLGHKEGDLPVTEECSRSIISLPMFPDISDEQIEYVAQEIKNYLQDKTV